MNELQSCELDILKAVLVALEACEIPYFLIGGSVLGAVKYKGFIPWDDDIDIGLYREEFVRFLSEAQKYLPEHLFLQTYQTDSQYTQIYAKVRNSNTTYIEKGTGHLRINQGVYIDVFPLDGYPKDVQKQEKLERKKRRFKLICDSPYFFARKKKEAIVAAILRMMGSKYWAHKVVKQYEKMISEFPVGGSKLICNHGNWKGKREYVPREYYGSGTAAEFEGLRVRIPEQYDEYLFQKYGNWREDPPPREQVGHHYHEICDLAHPYSDYIKAKHF